MLSSMQPLLAVQGIGYQLAEHTILKNISLDVKEGEVIGLIGPNGSGKTTLFNVLSGFLSPQKGTISYKGENITKLSPAKRAQKGVGRVFQNFGIFREMTLEENVQVALEALAKEDRQKISNIKTAVHETLKMVGLENHAKKKAGSLSGGQMRLLEIARTFKSGKELFLLDEPTAGVSPKMTHQVADLISELKKQGKTVLIIEHDLPFIAKVCDEVIVLDLGEVVLKGKPEDVKKSKQLQEIYFGANPAN